MKFLILTMLGACFVSSALAVDRTELDNRIRKLAIKLETLQTKSDKAIPAQHLRNTKGIILLDRTKAGFLFAYQGGGGIVIAKDPKTERWSPPAFLSANEASLGFQIGGQQSFVAILLMNTNAVQMVAQGSFKFGGEASGTAGNASAEAEGSISSTEPVTLIYTDREGLYGGAAIKGDALALDSKANLAYYGEYLSLKEILFDNKVKPSAAATDLATKIDQLAK